MSRSLRVAVAMTVMTTVISCSSRRTELPGFDVSARNFDVSPLVGEWKGTFINPEMHRQGTIVFTLAGRDEKAIGEIVLLPTSPTGDTARAPVVPAQPQQVLQISFIRLEGDNVVGRVEPYQSTACNCRVTSTFRGALTGNVIEGTYIVLGADDPSVRFGGNWKVTRVKRL
jgi:hypothetical protein